MSNRHLFLFGGSPPFGQELGNKFAELSMKTNGKVAILYNERDGWREYMPKYTDCLKESGLKNFHYISIISPSESVIEQLTSCTGIIICGGETEKYHKYIVDTEIGQCIKKMYLSGIPVAGFSAGALISPSHCVIPPIDNSRHLHLFLKGLGLIKNCVISVHFSTWNEEINLKTAIKKTKVANGYGLDDETGVYFLNESISETEGGKLYEINNSGSCD